MVALHHVRIFPAQHIDMRRHVLQMTGIRHQVDQRIAGVQGPLRVRRHFHQVQIHVQQSGMLFRSLVREPVERGFEHFDRFRGIRAFRRFAGR